MRSHMQKYVTHMGSAYAEICNFRNTKICGEVCDMWIFAKYMIYAAIT